ncbi:MAG: hypothetical protein KKH04_19125 [Proteobacteria bacterium]|nr:hypothetical protein [Pseudomonadota bacterium]
MVEKIKVDGFGEIDVGQSKEAKEAERFRKEKGLDDTSLTENAEGQQAKTVREGMFDETFGRKPKAAEKKPEEDKEPFASLRAELKELSESLAAQGVKYFPLIEFQSKLETWSAEVSLKESDNEDVNAEFKKVKSSSLKLADEVKSFRSRK